MQRNATSSEVRSSMRRLMIWAWTLTSRGHGLVENQQARLHCERAGYGGALALSA